MGCPRLPQSPGCVARWGCSWSSGHQDVPTDTEHHRHHHQHSQHCAHHLCLDSAVSSLADVGFGWSDGGRGDPELNDYVGTVGTAAPSPSG
jgi:hypothetical protein